MRENTKSSYEEVVSTPEGRRLLEQELLLVNAANLIAELLEEKGLKRAELAQRIGKSKAFVTQVLRGRNMTLRTLADLTWALGARVKLQPTAWHQESGTRKRAVHRQPAARAVPAKTQRRAIL